MRDWEESAGFFCCTALVQGLGCWALSFGLLRFAFRVWGSGGSGNFGCAESYAQRSSWRLRRFLRQIVTKHRTDGSGHPRQSRWACRGVDS